MTEQSEPQTPQGCSPGFGRRCCGRSHAGGRGTFIEPAAIASLLAGGSHGYDMRRIILEMTDGQVDADAGGLYRSLRRLEEEGYVVSAWCEEGSGPRRRDYELTDAGFELAQHWVLHLREREKLAGMLAGLLETGLADEVRLQLDSSPSASGGES